MDFGLLNFGIKAVENQILFKFVHHCFIAWEVCLINVLIALEVEDKPIGELGRAHYHVYKPFSLFGGKVDFLFALGGVKGVLGNQKNHQRTTVDMLGYRAFPLNTAVNTFVKPNVETPFL